MKNKYYSIQGLYQGQWEEVTAEYTKDEAEKRLKEYNENEPEYAHRIKVKYE